VNRQIQNYFIKEKSKIIKITPQRRPSHNKVIHARDNVQHSHNNNNKTTLSVNPNNNHKSTMFLGNVNDIILLVKGTSASIYTARIVEVNPTTNEITAKHDSRKKPFVVRQDEIFVAPHHRNVEKVESYADVDDDVLDIEMKMEKDEDELYDENKEWDVDDILGRRNGEEEVEFLVKWKDCKGLNDNTWEPFSLLSENKLLLEYIEEWMMNQQPIKIEDTSDDDIWTDNVEKHLESWNKSLE
jgi:hypothetical protein